MKQLAFSAISTSPANSYTQGSSDGEEEVHELLDVRHCGSRQPRSVPSDSHTRDVSDDDDEVHELLSIHELTSHPSTSAAVSTYAHGESEEEDGVRAAGHQRGRLMHPWNCVRPLLRKGRRVSATPSFGSLSTVRSLVTAASSVPFRASDVTLQPSPEDGGTDVDQLKAELRRISALLSQAETSDGRRTTGKEKRNTMGAASERLSNKCGSSDSAPLQTVDTLLVSLSSTSAAGNAAAEVQHHLLPNFNEAASQSLP
eukprot:CAMPEP_0177775590 /NCGR_PEP_ID=MMETSP0491_2-20121128/14209_1 /TAXON_ID=63592 /ORGANISM="Tetraselmis chuii, Strain PLY429" /LENGTH=256 /DNA_ID=CAMNT_0019294221 /DNA_START=14 /DNA_END=785 /DNA_ORIENTATION=+